MDPNTKWIEIRKTPEYLVDGDNTSIETHKANNTISYRQIYELGHNEPKTENRLSFNF